MYRNLVRKKMNEINAERFEHIDSLKTNLQMIVKEQLTIFQTQNDYGTLMRLK